MAKSSAKPKNTGPKTIPSVVQLPGGIRLTGILFRITEYDAEGRPKTFEIMPPGAAGLRTDGCWLFGDETWIREPNSLKAAEPRPDRDALEAGLERVLFVALLSHPLPWRVEQDWTLEVTADDGFIIAKCRTMEEARAIIDTATAVQARLDKLAAEPDDDGLLRDKQGNVVGTKPKPSTPPPFCPSVEQADVEELVRIVMSDPKLKADIEERTRPYRQPPQALDLTPIKAEAESMTRTAEKAKLAEHGVIPRVGRPEWDD